MRRMFQLAVSGLALSGLALGVAHAQPAPPAAAEAEAEAPAAVTAQERATLINDLARSLEANYYEPATGRRYAVALREAEAKGAYANLSDPAALGERLSADLQAVNPDRHLRVAPAARFARPRPRPTDMPASTQSSGPPGMEEAKMIGDIAYLRFNQFIETKDPAAARDFLLQHADARAVIIDARPHRGGGVEVMAAILPLLYPQKATLVRMDARADAPEVFPAGLKDVLVEQSAPKTVTRHDHVVTPDKAETRLQRVPIYYLTSRRSASAAEHLALAFKRTGRGVLIGETTAGANHFGDIQTFGRFSAFIPVGRTYDPVTGQDWEGTGIAPDVAVHADQALDEALKRAQATVG